MHVVTCRLTSVCMHAIIMCDIDIIRYEHFRKGPPKIDGMLCTMHDALQGKRCYTLVKQSVLIA